MELSTLFALREGKILACVPPYLRMGSSFWLRLAHQAGIVVNIFERLACSLCYAEEGIFGDVEGDVDFVAQTLCQTAEKRATTSEVDAVFHNVGIQFGRSV